MTGTVASLLFNPVPFGQHPGQVETGHYVDLHKTQDNVQWTESSDRKLHSTSPLPREPTQTTSPLLHLVVTMFFQNGLNSFFPQNSTHNIS